MVLSLRSPKCISVSLFRLVADAAGPILTGFVLADSYCNKE